MYECAEHADELWFTFIIILMLTALGTFALGYGLRARQSRRRRQRSR